MPIQIEVVGKSFDFMINGAAAAPNGRLFGSVPNWTEQPGPGVVEILPDCSVIAFPGNGWNDPHSKEPAAKRFVAVHSIFADSTNHLWVVDDAAPLQARDESIRPKIVDIDLTSNKVVKTYELDIKTAPPGAVLGHVRADEGHLYVTDSAHGSIIVIERESERARTLLSGHPKTQADPTIRPMIDGEPFQKPNGDQLVVNLNLIEIVDGWLYFTCLFGPILRRLRLSDLHDESASATDLGNAIEDVASIPPCAGLMRGPRGEIFISAFTHNAVLEVNGAAVRTVVADPRISFPNEGSVGPDGCLYIPACQAHRIALFQQDRKSRVVLPWEVLKIDVSGR